MRPTGLMKPMGLVGQRLLSVQSNLIRLGDEWQCHPKDGPFVGNTLKCQLAAHSLYQAVGDRQPETHTRIRLLFFRGKEWFKYPGMDVC